MKKQFLKFSQHSEKPNKRYCPTDVKNMRRHFYFKKLKDYGKIKSL